MNAAECYDLRTAGIQADLPAIARLVGSAASVLEVGAGTGRVLADLAPRTSARLWGVERDTARIAIARAKPALSKRVRWIEGDFLSCLLPDPVDVVLFAFNVLAEFETPESRVRALERARELVQKAGRVILANDAEDPVAWAHAVVEHEWDVKARGIGLHFRLRCERDTVLRVSRCRIAYTSSAFEGVIEDAWSMALLSRDDLLAAYRAAGLSVDAEYGDFALGPLARDSRVLLHALRP